VADPTDDVVEIKKAELAEAVRQSFSVPGCDVINSDVAQDPEYQDMIRDRLECVGNNAFGDISAQIERSATVEPSSLVMIRNYLRSNHARPA
jgi:hypothetical protein